MRLETEERFGPWSWYIGALHQHHMGLLMLMEVFMFQDRKENVTIWRYLDWIFEVPITIKAHQKPRYVLTMVRDHMAQYVATKRLRCPTDMNSEPLRHWDKRVRGSSSQGSLNNGTKDKATGSSNLRNDSGRFLVPAQPAGSGSNIGTANGSQPASQHSSFTSSQEVQPSPGALIDSLGRAALVQTGMGNFSAPEMDVDWVCHQFHHVVQGKGADIVVAEARFDYSEC